MEKVTTHDYDKMYKGIAKGIVDEIVTNAGGVLLSTSVTSTDVQ